MIASEDVPVARVESWDLFCRVVDNYGDIGVAWRLARQLASTARRAIRLVVDDLHAFARIESRIDTDAQCQRIDAIDVVRWRADGWREAGLTAEPTAGPADVVVELFGCGLPQGYIDAMARATTPRPAIWIDLEYLSAESWVDDFHGLPSPHPTLPLVKHFFYPGFGPKTGGVPIEAGLDDRRIAFLEDAAEVDAFWRRLQAPRPATNETRLSLFAYAGAPLAPLLEAMTDDPARRWSVVAPEGVLPREIEACFGVDARGSLSIFTIPFVDQDDYDRLLWCCDINFVRGEDSFVRAQWAARPFVWHIYPQADDAHKKKLHAFEDRYEGGLPRAARDAQRALWEAWNVQPHEGCTKAWAHWSGMLPELSAHAQVWRQNLASQTGLVDRLLSFVAERRAALLK